MLGNVPWLTTEEICSRSIVRSMDKVNSRMKERRLHNGGSFMEASVTDTDYAMDYINQLIKEVVNEKRESRTLNKTEALQLNVSFETLANLIVPMTDTFVDSISVNRSRLAHKLVASKRNYAKILTQRSSLRKISGKLGHEKQARSKRTSYGRRRSSAKRRLEQLKEELLHYEGTYGDDAYGNVTVSLQEYQLVLQYNRVRWSLVPVVERIFQAVGEPPFWYWTMIIVFDMNEDGYAYQLYIPFEREAITIFRRNHKADDSSSLYDTCNLQDFA